ncbi:hypothetical protein Hanom_Chr16g01448261 [Helianthus anomalus]
MGELHFRLSDTVLVVVTETLLHSSGNLMEENGGFHQVMLCRSRSRIVF